MKVGSPFRCIGLAGRIRGHKFIWSAAFMDSYVVKDHCQRCGMPLGGWPL